MPKYCPQWLFDCITAQCGIDYIEIGHGLSFISKKYTDGLNEDYDGLSSKELEQNSEKFLRALSDYNINDKSINFLKTYIFYRFNYSNRYVKRNFNSIFLDPFVTKKKNNLENDEGLASLRAFIFEWRSKATVKVKKNWSLGTQKEFKKLANLVQKPLSEHERKLILRETRKLDFQETWTKK